MTPTAEKMPQGKRWLPDENEVLAKAWIDASEDRDTGTMMMRMMTMKCLLLISMVMFRSVLIGGKVR